MAYLNAVKSGVANPYSYRELEAMSVGRVFRLNIYSAIVTECQIADRA